MSKRPLLPCEWLGLTAYLAAWERQKELASAFVGARSGEAIGRLLLVEHPPTYTFGRRGTAAHLLLDEATLKAEGIAVHWVDRGGDVTYHGPGQLVGYPVIDLRRLHRGKLDLHHYLRQLEAVLIGTLRSFGINGVRMPGYTGVWVESAAGASKIGAIGVKVNQHGIATHGFSLNIAPNLTHFQGIIPCGITAYGVTSMAALMGEAISIESVRPRLVAAVADALEVETAVVSA